MSKFAALLLIALAAAGCSTTPAHQFAQPTRDWIARSGQLSYRGKAVLIGEVLVRFSRRGDFELTFSKGPGLALLTMRTGPQFARISGPLVGIPWSGPISRPPARDLGWLALRRQILEAPRKQIFRVSEGGETFVLRF